MRKITDAIKNLSVNIVNGEISKVQKSIKKNSIIGNIVILLFVLMIGVCSFILVKNMMLSGVTNFASSFSKARSDAKEEAYATYYDSAYGKAYEKARRENAINNDVFIMVDEIREMSKYEVLSVIEDATVIETAEQKEEGIYSWVRYKGKGEFTVDLEQSEIIVDHENYYVLIKIPHPKMTYVPLPNETEELLYKDDRTNFIFWQKKDNATGFDIAQEQESIGNAEIYEKLMSNGSYLERANEAAINGLTQLVKSLNSDIADKLIIEISFND